MMCSWNIKINIFTILFIILIISSGCTTINNIQSLKSAGTAKIYNIDNATAHNITRDILEKWLSADIVATDKNYIVSSVGKYSIKDSFCYDKSILIAVWFDSGGGGHTQITVVVRPRAFISGINPLFLLPPVFIVRQFQCIKHPRNIPIYKSELFPLFPFDPFYMFSSGETKEVRFHDLLSTGIKIIKTGYNIPERDKLYLVGPILRKYPDSVKDYENELGKSVKKTFKKRSQRGE